MRFKDVENTVVYFSFRIARSGRRYRVTLTLSTANVASGFEIEMQTQPRLNMNGVCVGGCGCLVRTLQQ